MGDFDIDVRRFLLALHSSGSRQKVREALLMIHMSTVGKSRIDVERWPAYLLALLKRFKSDQILGHDRSIEKLSNCVGNTPTSVAKCEIDEELVPMCASKSAGVNLDVPKHNKNNNTATANKAFLIGWDSGHQVLLEEIHDTFVHGYCDLLCPFTMQKL